MKIVSQVTSLSIKSLVSVNGLSFSTLLSSVLLPSTLLSGALLLSGCQSTNLSQSNAIAANNTPASAKTALATALQQQRRQSFTYHSNLEINNDQQFMDVDTTQLVATDYVDMDCEDTHDQAYAALLTETETQNKDISAIDYSARRVAFKQSYLECIDAYQAWRDDRYDSDAYSVEGAADDSQDDSSFITSDTVTNDTDLPYHKTAFAEVAKIQNKQAKLDIKKAKLLDAYLLKPLSINAQGVYQPLAGKFTMLASTQYQTRNHHSSINQPIYIDFKTGNIYLWADNFALLTSNLLDDKLGAKWQNKWLKLTIDDGTLPKGFGRAVIKNHFEALDRSYEAVPVTQFSFIASDSLTALSPKLPEQQLVAMLKSKQVIRRSQSSDSYEQSYKDYMRIFYELMSQQYPELVKNSMENEQDNSDSGNVKFTSKVLVQQALAMMKDMVNNNDNNNNNNNESSEILPESSADLNVTVQELYGFNQRGQLQWQHFRSPLPNTTSRENKSSKDMTIDILQQYSPIRGQDMAFPNLPSDVQTPNASNSIDLREYSGELAEYYSEGNGSVMGKMLFSIMPLYKNRFGAAVE